MSIIYCVKYIRTNFTVHVKVTLNHVNLSEIDQNVRVESTVGS